MPDRIVTVAIPQTPKYDITVAPGLLERAGSLLRDVSKSAKAAVVTDSNLAATHLPALVRSLNQGGFETVTTTLPAGEDHKTLSDLVPAYDALLGARIERSTPVLALGGGVVGDMTGFVAATVLRGVPFVQIPTTLLAMVDASVGGKTGVNHAVGKNLIGAFHQPIAVMIDPAVLRTLPARELRSGLAECIKHDIIRDAVGFAALERDIGRALSVDVEYLSELIAHNVAIKARVVEADPFERGERAHLNFGHTFGHAIETVSNYSYAHGECVALGMAAAVHAATKLGMIGAADRDRVIAVIDKAGLPTRGLTLDPGAVVEAMHFDKKVRSGKVRFVLPDRIGHVVIRDDLAPGLVREAVESLKG
jgi:3-dehydroquinate synthase